MFKKVFALLMVALMVCSVMPLSGITNGQTRPNIIILNNSTEMNAGTETEEAAPSEGTATTTEVTTEAELTTALAAGGEVVLGADIKVTAEIEIPAGVTTLDLNGHSITSGYQTGSTTKHIYPLNNKGTLTITDTVGTGSITGRGIYNQDAATLTVNGAKIVAEDTNGGSGIWCYGETSKVYLNDATIIGNTGCVSSEGYLEINGGTYTCYSGIADDGTQITAPTYNIRAYNGLKITDGTFTSRHGVISLGGGTGVIEDGSYTIEFAADTTSNVVYVYSDAAMTINGGEFISDNTSGKANSGAAVLVSGTDARLTINDGEFVGMNGMVSINDNTVINGGSFDTVWDSNGYGSIESAVTEGAVVSVGGTTYTKTEDGLGEATSDIKIGTIFYETLDDAVAAAAKMTGDVVVELYGKVTLTSNLSGDFTSIKFVGKDTDAEIYLNVQGFITAVGKKVAFEKLILSKSEGAFITDAGFMNVAFGVYNVDEVTYDNCTFTNGAYASSGNVTYNGCTFYRSHEKYALWAYGNVDVTVDGCTFADYRGIKMYAEGAAKTVDLTVKNTDFSAVSDKPAIVLTYGESVTLEGNTYSSTGTFELDLDGAPNGTPIASDVAPTCKNDNGACGVLVDGKIYTTVAQAAEVAASGSTVTLLHNSTETVAFAEGVTLDKNGYTADGVTVTVPVVNYVARIGETNYETLAEAVANATAGDTITVIADVADEAITVDKNLTITGTATLNNVSINAVEGCTKLTVSGLAFTGNSWINSGAADELTVSGVTANVTPSNTSYTNSRSAFISLGRSEQKELALTVENCNIVANGGADPILGWAAITKADITGNTFGSADAYQTNSDSVKFMSIADGAVFTITGNTVYSNYNGFVFGQNTTRDNAYTVYVDDNTFIGSADHVWLEVSDSGTCHATVNATSDNTVNGNTFTADDIKYSSSLTTFTSYAGVDVVTDADGKVIGGDLKFYAEEAIADGYEVGEDGKVAVAVTYVAQIGDVQYTSLEAAIAALKANGGTLVLLADANEAITFEYPTEGAPTELVIDLNGFTVTSATSTLVVADGYNVTVKDSSTAQTGKIVTTSSGDEAIAIKRGGKVTLEGGTVEGVGYGVYLYAGNATGEEAFTVNGGTVTVPNGGNAITVGSGTVTVNGGKVLCNKVPNGGGWNTYVYEDGTLIITGGEFLGTIGSYGTTSISGGTFSYCDDPNDGFNNEHLAQGYTTQENEDGSITVVALPAAPEGFVWVSTYEQLLAALENDNAKVIFANDITATATQSSGYGVAGIVVDAGDIVDGNGYKLTINGANTTWDCAIAMRGGEVKNLTIAGAMRGVFMPGAKGDVVIDNCVFEDVVYTFNSDAGSKDYTVTIKNTELNGWTSFSDVHGEVIFDTCTFAEGSGYAFCRPFQATTFTNCAFADGFELDATKTADETLAFTDCTYAGEEINAENALDLFYNGGEVLVNGEAVDYTRYAQIVRGEETLVFTSLEAAIEAAETGDTITLLADVELTATVVIDLKGDITIDGNGKTITMASDFALSTHGAAIMLGTAGGEKDVNGQYVYTIKNVTFDGFTEKIIRAQSITLQVEDSVIKNANVDTDLIGIDYTDATFDSVTFESNTTTGNALINFNANVNGDSTADLTFVDCRFIKNQAALGLVLAQLGGDFTVKTGSFVDNSVAGTGTCVLYTAMNSTISGNLFENNTAGKAVIVAGPYTEGEFTIVINGNAFVGDSTAVHAEDFSASYSADTAFNLNDNYWNGGEPAYNVTNTPAVTLGGYYTTYTDGTLGGWTEVVNAVEINGYVAQDTHVNGWTTVWGQLTIKGTESFYVEIYSGETYLGKTTLVDTDKVLLDGQNHEVTWHAFLDGSDSWWNTEWTVAPVCNMAPTSVKYYVDGKQIGGGAVKMSSPDDLRPVTWAELRGVYSAAKIGNTYYATLADAIAAAEAGDTITLLADVVVSASIDITKKVILDLAGKKITPEAGAKMSAGILALREGGDLTINDSVGGGEINYNGETAVYTAVGLFASDAKLTVKGGKLVGYYYGVAGNGSYDGTTITVDGGEIASIEGTGSGIYHPQSGTLTVNGGTITGATGIYFKSGTLVITGGTINGTGAKVAYGYVASGSDATGDALVIENVGTVPGYEPIVSVSITGGTFISANASAVASYAATVTNPSAVVVTDFITGGTFNTDVSAYCADGYAVEKNEDDDTYGVVVALPEVEVTDIKDTLTDNDPDLTFALNFAIKDMDKLTEAYLEDLLAAYGDWYTDYVLTISGLSVDKVIFNANGNGDGYLAGQYDAWSENWVSVPFEDVEVANGQSLYIMEYAAKLMNKQGLRYTLAEVAAIVQNFDCGVYFTPEFLAANPNLQVTLELKVFTEDENGNKIDDISVATNEFDKDDFGVAAVVANGKQTQYFATLADAIAAAEDGDTVTLLSDIDLGTNYVTVKGKEITLNLNGHNITGSGNRVLMVDLLRVDDADKKGVLTLIGEGTVENTGTDTGNSHAVYVGGSSELIVGEGATVKSDNGFTVGLFPLGAGRVSTLTVNGGTVTGKYGVSGNGLVTDTSTVVTVNSGSIEGTEVAIYQPMFGTVTVNGGSVIGGTDAAIAMRRGELTVNGGTVKGLIDILGDYTAATATFNGGDFTNATLKYADGNTVTKADAVTLAAPEGYKWVDGVLTAIVYVAQIGDVKYETLAEAIAAAEDGDTVILLADATLASTLNVNKGVTVNGNGKTINGSMLVTANTTFAGTLNLGGNVKVTGGATLTVAADAVVTGATSFFGAGNDESYYGIDNAEIASGTIVINGTLTIQQMNANAGGVVTVAEGGKLTTAIVCVENGSVANATAGVMNINGEVETQRFNVFGGATATVGATGKLSSEQAYTSAAMHSVISISGGGQLIIEGEVTAAQTTHTEGRHSSISVGADSSITISGTLNVGGDIVNEGTITLTTLDAKLITPTTGLTVASGVTDYTATYENATYYLISSFDAQIGDVKYATLTAALASAANGDVITVLRDVDLTGEYLIMEDGVTFDLNAYTVTAKGFIAWGNTSCILDNGETKGRLALSDMNHLSLQQSKYGMLPVWAEDGSGFVFTTVNPQAELYSKGNDKFAIEYRPSIKGYLSTSQLFKNGAADNGITFQVVIHCYDANGNDLYQPVFSVSDELVEEVYTAVSQGESQKIIYTDITGAGTKYAKYGVEIRLVSASGVAFSAMLDDTFTPTASAE